MNKMTLHEIVRPQRAMDYAEPISTNDLGIPMATRPQGGPLLAGATLFMLALLGGYIVTGLIQ